MVWCSEGLQRVFSGGIFMASARDGERVEQTELYCSYHHFEVGKTGWGLSPTEETYTLQRQDSQLYLWLGTLGGWVEEDCGVVVEITNLPLPLISSSKREEERD
jgi:hypothetical protein